MTIPDAPVTYAVTRIALLDALGNVPLGEHLHLEARGKMADALLAQMPEASAEPAGADLYRAVNDAIAVAVVADRARIAQLADQKRAVYCKPCDGAPCSYDDELAPFADLIREQP